MKKIKFSTTFFKSSFMILFILMQIFLIFLKRHHALDLDVTPGNQPSPNIYQTERVGQTFIAKRNSLARIDILIGTHGRNNDKDVIFVLREKRPERKVERKIIFNASTIPNNLYYPLEFKPIRKSKGKEYYFILQSPESTYENSICVWTNTNNIYSEGASVNNNAPVRGDLIFRAYSKKPVFTELTRIVRHYDGLFGSVWLLVLAILFFELVQILLLSKILDFIHGKFLKEKDSKMKTFDILVISDDVVGEKMAGPGIRAWELSKCLSQHFKVVLAIPDYSLTPLKSPFFEKTSFQTIQYSVQKPDSLLTFGEQSKIIITQGYILSKFPSLLQLKAYKIADIYVPFILENLFVHKGKIASLKDREYIHLQDLKVFNEQILKCDHFLCTHSRQKALFSGSMMSLNRINPEILDLDPTLEELISIVPFGISSEKEKPGKSGILRKKFPQIKEEDVIFLWGGVLTNWFDPITLINAFSDAVKENPHMKLIFMSTKHANPLLPEFDMAIKAVKISEKLGLTGKHIFFHKEWVNYLDRRAFYREADVGLSITPHHFENDYAFRTRMLDYMRDNLPILCTTGDHFAEIVAQEKLGITVQPGHQEDLRKALLSLAKENKLREKYSRNIRKIKNSFTWENTTQPLIAHCEKVLSGEIKKKNIPTQKGLEHLFFPQKESFWEKIGKKFFWSSIQKMNMGLSVKLRRFFKS
ncbi:MAG: glycosyltransferase [Candidatus Aminicenantes bacterium]|nr:glycosyltransferase [Candidatus Aminicenantes bacterium]